LARSCVSPVSTLLNGLSEVVPNFGEPSWRSFWDPPGPLLVALECHETQVKCLIHSINSSLTILRNATELLRVSPSSDEASSILENQAEEVIHKVRQLEETLFEPPQWNGPEPHESPSHVSVMWVPEKPPHKGIEKILLDTISPRASIFTAHSVSDAMEMIRFGEFHMMVTGYRLGEMTGGELLRSFKELGIWLPAVMATRTGDETLAARCMKEGFLGYFSARMLRDPEQVRAILRDTLAEAVRLRRWVSSIKRVGRLAMTDALTSVHNRYFIEQLLQMEMGRSKRYGQPFCVALLDLDGFKEVNDTLGHAAGDEVLRKVAGVLKKTARSTDHIGRFGGDEFLLILPQADGESGLRVCERILEAMRREFRGSGNGIPRIGLSVGLTHWSSEKALSVDGIMELTDKALYRAKEKGGDRIWMETPP